MDISKEVMDEAIRVVNEGSEKGLLFDYVAEALQKRDDVNNMYLEADAQKINDQIETIQALEAELEHEKEWHEDTRKYGRQASDKIAELEEKLEKAEGEIERIKQHLEPTREEWGYLVNAKTVKLEAKLKTQEALLEEVGEVLKTIKPELYDAVEGVSGERVALWQTLILQVLHKLQQRKEKGG